MPQLLRINNENVTSEDRELAGWEKDVGLGGNGSGMRLRSGSIKINNSSIEFQPKSKSKPKPNSGTEITKDKFADNDSDITL